MGITDSILRFLKQHNFLGQSSPFCGEMLSGALIGKDCTDATFVKKYFTVMEAPGTDDFLYNQIVSRLAFQIQTQVLKPGDKLPSVRALSQEQRISVSTAFKAYSELENKGLVEARPRSAFYVRGPLKRTAFSRLAPSPADMEEQPSPLVAFPQVLREVYGTLADPHLIKLSLSTPTLNLIPFARLNMALGHVVR